MPAPKGRKKAGGRKKGTPNKDRGVILERVLALGKDPIEVKALFMNGDWKALGYDCEKYITTANDHGTFWRYTIDPALRVKCAIELAQYCYAKRKAIEISGPDGGPIRTENNTDIIEKHREELRRVWLQQLAERRKKAGA